MNGLSASASRGTSVRLDFSNKLEPQKHDSSSTTSVVQNDRNDAFRRMCVCVCVCLYASVCSLDTQPEMKATSAFGDANIAK